MLAVPALALGLHKVGTWLDQVEGHLSEAQLLVFCGVLTAAQLPGLFFGANPIQLLVDQYRGVGSDPAPDAGDAAQLPEAAGDPLHVHLVVMETVPLTTLWHTGGSCTMDSLLGSPRGVAIDGRLGYVYATGVEPPRIARLELEDGAVIRIWDDGQLPEPVDAAWPGTQALVLAPRERCLLAEDDMLGCFRGTGTRPGSRCGRIGRVAARSSAHTRSVPRAILRNTAWTGYDLTSRPCPVNRPALCGVPTRVMLNLPATAKCGCPNTTIADQSGHSRTRPCSGSERAVS